MDQPAERVILDESWGFMAGVEATYVVPRDPVIRAQHEEARRAREAARHRAQRARTPRPDDVECRVCGVRTTPGPLALHQRATGHLGTKTAADYLAELL